MNVASRWLRRVVIWLGPLTVLFTMVLCGFLYWVIASPSGTRWALVTAVQQIDGQVSNISGTLWDGVSVGSLSATLPDVAVHLEGFHLQVDWHDLLNRRLHVIELSAGVVDVDLTGEPKEDQATQPFSMPELPVKIIADNVAVGQVRVSQHGEPLLPAELSNIATALYLDGEGAQLSLRNLDITHEELAASLEGEARVLSLQDPWPMQVDLDVRATGRTQDSPLCARNYLATLPAEQAKSTAAKPDEKQANREKSAAKGKQVNNAKPAKNNKQVIAEQRAASNKTAQSAKSTAGNKTSTGEKSAAGGKKSTDEEPIAGSTSPEETKPAPESAQNNRSAEDKRIADPVAPEAGKKNAAGAKEQQSFTPCVLDLHAVVKGDLDALDVTLRGSGQGMRVNADAHLTPRAAFPLEHAVADLELADGSTLHGKLDWEAGVQGDATLDRLFGSLNTLNLNVGQLVGPAIPDALLTVDADFDLLLQNRSALQSAKVAMKIAQGSRWNKQALSGHLNTHVISSKKPSEAAVQEQVAATAKPTTDERAQEPASAKASASDKKAAAGIQLTTMLDGLQLAALDMDLTLGKNHLKAKGALGVADNSLDLDVLAPQLDAFWPDLPGGVTAKGFVAGTLANHKADLKVVYTPEGSKPDELGKAPADVHVVLDGHWGKRPGSARASAPAAVAGGSKPDAGNGSASSAPGAEVKTAEQAVTPPNNAGQAPLPSKTVASALEGWRGTISKLDAKHATFAASLNSPVAVSFYPGTQPPAWEWEAGPTTLALFMGSRKLVTLDHAGSRGGEGRWESRGKIDHLVVSRKLVEEVQQALGTLSEKVETKGGIKIRGAAKASPTEIDLALDWDLKFSGVLEGTAHVKRIAGDVIVPAEPSFPLGLKTLTLGVKASRANNSTSQILVDLEVETEKMGSISAQAKTVLHADGMRLYLEPKDPKAVQLKANVKDLGWLSLFTGDAMEFGGTLNADVTMDSKPDGTWTSNGTIRGDKIRVIRIDDGIRLLDGTLLASVKDDTLVLESLKFPARLRTTPKEWRTAEWVSSNPDAKDGSLTITGDWNLFESAGDIDVAFYRYPLLQRSDRYAMITGDLTIAIAIPKIEVKGSVVADAGWVDLDMLSSIPTLDSDVVVIRAGDDRNKKKAASPVDVSLDLDVDLGPRFYLTGYGVNSGLTGKLHITMVGDKLTAIGALHTRGGAIETYGQRLQLRRGTVTFQGDIASPVLDIEALRTGLAVEAGVRVAGTARRPRIDLVSYPAVSEIEKLSWLLLGHGPDDSGGGDAALLFSVGSSFLSDGEPFYRRFGIDEVSMRSGELGGAGSILPADTVVKGLDVSSSDVEQRFIVASKALSAGFTVSVRQALSDTGTVGHISYRLARGLTAELSVGTVNGLALVYRWFSRE